MSSNVTIVSILYEKTISIYNINGSLQNTINNNEPINLIYNPYIIHLSNPIHTQFTDILVLSNTFLGNFLLFIFVLILLMVFSVLVLLIKKHGVN